MSLPGISPEDRQHILSHTSDLWPMLQGQRLFITGATGFYGKWLLEAIATANERLDTRISATLLSRDPNHFAHAHPELARHSGLDWLAGSTADFVYPTGKFDALIDFATPSAVEVGAGGTALIDTTLAGTCRLIEFARQSGLHRVLYASSGAVAHGTNEYADLKRRSESLWLTSGLDCIITRGYSFIGPYLPLTDKFAAGSFIRDALAGVSVILRDGTPLRSYLYAADMSIWLLKLLAQGKPGQAYDMGSDQPVSIAQLARKITAVTGTEVIDSGTAVHDQPAPAYLPQLGPEHQALGLKVWIDLDEAISRTLQWATITLPRLS